MSDFWTLYQEFEATRLKHPYSRRNYRVAIQSIEEFSGKEFLSITSKDALEYSNQYRHEKSSTPGNDFYTSTGNLRLSILRSIANYMVERIPGYQNPFASIMIAAVKPYGREDILSLDEVSDALAYAEVNGCFREFLAISLALRLCLTTTEIVNLVRDDFFEQDGKCCLNLPKRILLIPEDIIAMINSFFPQFFSSSPQTPLLSHVRTGRPLSAGGLSNQIASLNQNINLRKVRTLGILLIMQNGNDEKEVAHYIGNEGIWMKRYQNLLKYPIDAVTLPNIDIHRSPKTN